MNRTASSGKPYLNREVVADRDRFYMAMLRRVGIEKGKPFKPNARQRMILEEAALVGEAMPRRVISPSAEPPLTAGSVLEASARPQPEPAGQVL